MHTLEVLLSRLSRILPWQAGPGNRTVSMLITNLPAFTSDGIPGRANRFRSTEHGSCSTQAITFPFFTVFGWTRSNIGGTRFRRTNRKGTNDSSFSTQTSCLPIFSLNSFLVFLWKYIFPTI